MLPRFELQKWWKNRDLDSWSVGPVGMMMGLALGTHFPWQEVRVLGSDNWTVGELENHQVYKVRHWNQWAVFESKLLNFHGFPKCIICSNKLWFFNIAVRKPGTFTTESLIIWRVAESLEVSTPSQGSAQETVEYPNIAKCCFVAFSEQSARSDSKSSFGYWILVTLQ